MTTGGAGGEVTGGRGTLTQRARAGVVAVASVVACHMPERLLIAAADAAGELWYRTAPGRAAVARRNLGRVCAWLAAEGRGPARARHAATDRRELERIVRAAFRQQARYYVELLRAPTVTAAYVAERLVATTPEALERAFATPGGLVLVAAHLGPIELPAFVAAHGRTGPAVAVMETVADPALQAWYARSRASVGIRLVGFREARRELTGALEARGTALLIGDRDITGGGTTVGLFGHMAPLPSGPALLAIQAGAPLYFAAIRRTTPGRYSGWIREVVVPPTGALRARVLAVLEELARAIEDAVAEAPEQWAAVFFPIWPDLEAAGA